MLTPEQKDEAIAAARQSRSDDDVSVDGETADENFSCGDDGVWVKAWIFVDKERITGYEA